MPDSSTPTTTDRKTEDWTQRRLASLQPAAPPCGVLTGMTVTAQGDESRQDVVCTVEAGTALLPNGTLVTLDTEVTLSLCEWLKDHDDEMSADLCVNVVLSEQRVNEAPPQVQVTLEWPARDSSSELEWARAFFGRLRGVPIVAETDTPERGTQEHIDQLRDLVDSLWSGVDEVPVSAETVLPATLQVPSNWWEDFVRLAFLYWCNVVRPGVVTHDQLVLATLSVEKIEWNADQPSVPELASVTLERGDGPHLVGAAALQEWVTGIVGAIAGKASFIQSAVPFGKDHLAPGAVEASLKRDGGLAIPKLAVGAGGLTVSGAGDGSLTVTGGLTSLNGGLTVKGETTLQSVSASSVLVGGKAVAFDERVPKLAAANTFSDKQTISAGGLSVTGGLSVDTLSVSQLATVGGKSVAIAEQVAKLAGPNTFLAKQTISAGGLSVAGGVIADTLTVGGKAVALDEQVPKLATANTFSARQTISAGGLSVTGGLTVDTLTISNSATVSGKAVALDDQVPKLAAANTFSARQTISTGGLTVTGMTTLNSGLAVADNTTIGNAARSVTLTVGDAHQDGTIKLFGDFNVVANSTLKRPFLIRKIEVSVPSSTDSANIDTGVNYDDYPIACVGGAKVPTSSLPVFILGARLWKPNNKLTWAAYLQTTSAHGTTVYIWVLFIHKAMSDVSSDVYETTQ